MPCKIERTLQCPLAKKKTHGVQHAHPNLSLNSLNNTLVRYTTDETTLLTISCMHFRWCLKQEKSQEINIHDYKSPGYRKSRACMHQCVSFIQPGNTLFSASNPNHSRNVGFYMILSNPGEAWKVMTGMLEMMIPENLEACQAIVGLDSGDWQVRQLIR